MIERHWKGTVKKECAHEYFEHLIHGTFKQLEAMNGFISARILTRTAQEGIDCLIITVWQSRRAIEQFAGTSTDTAVVPVSVQEMMVKYDERVDHYELVINTNMADPI